MTTCIESLSCIPQTNPLEVFKAFDVTYGTGTTTIIMALILGVITMAIYMRTKSLTMLTVLGIYELGIFTTILTSQYLSSQYQIAIYVIGIAATSVFALMCLRLVKE